MLTLLQLAQMSADVYQKESETGRYTAELRKGGWKRLGEYERGNFFSRVYQKEGTDLRVLAYRGTDDILDLANDVLVLAKVLGTPQSGSAHWSLASCCEEHGAPGALTGHSLGGALAQLMGARHDYPFVSFNGPGMHVDRLPNTVFRGVGGMIGKAFRKESQKVDAAQYDVNPGVPRQLNIRTKGDLVSMEGPFGMSKLRMGETWSDLETVRPRRTLLGSHRIDTMVGVMRQNPGAFISD